MNGWGRVGKVVHMAQMLYAWGSQLSDLEGLGDLRQSLKTCCVYHDDKRPWILVLAIQNAPLL